MLNKLKILVPLDQPDIRGATCGDTSTLRFKPVFEDAVSLAKSLNAEIILLHILDRWEEESILQDGAWENDRFYSPADLIDLRLQGGISHFPVAHGEVLAEQEFEAWKAWNVPLDYDCQQSIQLLVAKARDESIAAKAMNMLDSRSLIICEAAAAWDADLIVMGRGKGAEWRCLRLDSVSTYVLHHASCSIVLVDPQTKDISNLRQILVAVDFSPNSQEIFRQGLSLAVRVRTAAIALKVPVEQATPTITLLHVHSYFDQDDYPEARGNVSLSWDFGISYDHAAEAAADALDKATRAKQSWVRSLKAQAEEHNIPVYFLERLAEDAEPQGISRFIPQPDAMPGQTICDVAAKTGADLIVLGYRREWELKKLLLGSVCNYVTHYSTCPVMIARNFKSKLFEGAALWPSAAPQRSRSSHKPATNVPLYGDHPMFNKILVAVDTSPNSEAVFAKAVSLAKLSGASLMVAHILSPFEEGYPEIPVYPGVDSYYPVLYEEAAKVYTKDLEKFAQKSFEFVQELANRATAEGVPTEFTQNSGEPGRLICELANNWGADLVVLGRRGRTGLSELVLGSVSNHVVHHAPCCVLTVQGKGTTAEDSAKKEEAIAR